MTTLCAALNHESTRQCVTAERSFLKELGGGCHLAVAAFAHRQDDQLSMRAVSFLQGSAVRAAGQDRPENAEILGRRLAEQVMA